MTTSTNPADDIIELTEIVEEGIPLNTKFEDFAMDKAVDAKSLDKELDDLLRETEPQSGAKEITDDEIDLDILFDEPAPAAEAKTPQADAGMDMSDIDNLFDSLGIGEKEDGETALDIILDGDIPELPEKKDAETFYPSESIDLELDLPATEGEEGDKAIHDLTEELLADIPETVLLHSPEETAPAAPQRESAPEEPDHESAASDAKLLPATGPEPEILELDAPVEEEVEPEFAQSPRDEDQPEAPVVHEDVLPEQPLPPAEQAVPQDAPLSRAALEIISARLDALETRPEPPQTLDAEEILALLPLSPQDVPLTRTLRQEIIDHLESRISELATSASVGGLQESVNALQGQVEALPDIQEELSKRLPESLIRKLESDLEALRARVDDRPDIQPEQIMAILPQAPQGWPVAQALRQEIVDHVESRISELASSSSVDGLQESVNALQSQVEALPDIRSELAKAPSASGVQKMEEELEELKILVRNQEDALARLRQTLTDKEAAIEALTAEGGSLREELADLADRVGAAPAADEVKDELREYVRQQVPLAAAKIIREEIQALLKELGG